MIADDFSDIAARLKQIEQKIESLRPQEAPVCIPIFVRPPRQLDASNVEFVQ